MGDLHALLDPGEGHESFRSRRDAQRTIVGEYGQVQSGTNGGRNNAGWRRPASKLQGARVTFSGTDRTVTKGPFANTNELVSGYWVWKLNSLEEAINWVKRCPNPMLESSDIEIRQLYEMADFARAGAKQ
jgi:hypothetical protein